MKYKDSLKILHLTSLLVAGVVTSKAQPVEFEVNKVKCNSHNSFPAAKLVIKYSTDTVMRESSFDYWLTDFIGLSDSAKLLIIGKLLTFENDTSLCCQRVVNRSFNGIEGCRGKPKDVDRYPIQIDALYMINRLCWPKLMELYSCSPVLYDKKLGRDINSNPKKIKLVFKRYKKWYATCKEMNRIPDYFPFNDSRYGWYGGRKGFNPGEKRTNLFSK